MSRFLKDYEEKKIESDKMKLEDEVKKLRNENESLLKRFKHLLESEFIRSFDMVTNNGQWQRPIVEADQITYGKGLINATLPPSDGGVMELQRKIKEDYSRNERVLKMLEPTEQPDAINPSHYNSTKISAFDVIDDWELNFYSGNVVKYIQRAGKKENNSELQDLKKAMRYLEKQIELLEGK